MPELPEVETTCRGIRPHVVDRTIKKVVVRESRLRWPVPADLHNQLRGQRVEQVQRRAKYLLLGTSKSTLIIHLGMSGRLQVLPAKTPPAKHDHVDIVLDTGNALRFNDPRRFGCILLSAAPNAHPLLSKLGPEPLSEDFHGDVLYLKSRGRKASIKSFIMDAAVVVGVGNIYASEALFMSKILPQRAAGRISRVRMHNLAENIKSVLSDAIRAGGTTLKDFYGADGSPGYFAVQLNAYGREGEPCTACGQAIRQKVIAQRSTFYCASCQR